MSNQSLYCNEDWLTISQKQNEPATFLQFFWQVFDDCQEIWPAEVYGEDHGT